MPAEGPKLEFVAPTFSTPTRIKFVCVVGLHSSWLGVLFKKRRRREERSATNP